MIDTLERGKINIKDLLFPVSTKKNPIEIPLDPKAVKTNGVDMDKLFLLMPDMPKSYKSAVKSWFYEAIMEPRSILEIISDNRVGEYLKNSSPLARMWGALAFSVDTIDQWRRKGWPPVDEDYDTIRETFLIAAKGFHDTNEPEFVENSKWITEIATDPQTFLWLTEIIYFKESTLPSSFSLGSSIEVTHSPVPEVRKF